MIFIGDLAFPDKGINQEFVSILNSHSAIFKDKRIIVNLEGLLCPESNMQSGTPVLCNSSTTIKSLLNFNQPVFCLANNHIHDIPGSFEATIRLFNDNSIPFFGARLINALPDVPRVFNEMDKNVHLFNACWDFLLYNYGNPHKGIWVEEIKERKMLREVSKKRETDPGCLIVVYLHWNLDLEMLPFPMHRRFAFDLIDSGANIIVGSHSHCIQGGEKYKNGYIIYGLGNFFIPNGIFINGKLTYPDFARNELAFEWNPETNSAICHWFRYENADERHELIYKGSEEFEDSATLAKYSPYTGMDNRTYLKYYIANRRKRFLIPVYKDYNSVFANRIRTSLLKTRARIARIFASTGMIPWQR
jgi:hypothetical protein